jgi:hypothetical protein
MKGRAKEFDAEWEQFFNDDPPTSLARSGAQLIEEDGSVKFVHKSVLEFFAAKAYYDNVMGYDPRQRECPLLDALILENESSVLSFLSDMIINEIKRHPKDTRFEDYMLQIFNSQQFHAEVKSFTSQRNAPSIFIKNVILIGMIHPNVYRRVLLDP